MSTAGPKDQIGQGIDGARTILDFNNSATSATKDRLFWALEWADGSVYLRNIATTVLHQLANGTTTPAYNRREMNKLTSLRERVAYVVGHRYGFSVNAAGTLVTSVNKYDENILRAELDEVISELQDRLMAEQDFDESTMLRYAAVNRFETKLNTKERTALTQLAGSLQKIAETEGYDVLAESMNFKQESDAQRLMKISEGITMLTNAGVTIDPKILDQADVTLEKIKPLKDLDKQYKHLNNVLNMIHRIGKEYPSMISAGEQKKVVAVLKDLGIDEVSQILDASKTIGAQDGYLEKQLYALKHKDPAKFTEALRKNNINDREFQGRYVSYFGYKSVERAKQDLDGAKATAFGHRLPDFEKDVNNWRGNARNRILATHARMTMVGGALAFGPGDLDFANSYFDKFKDIFYAVEEDAYGANGGHYQQMLDIVSAIVRARVPSLTAANPRRFGHGIRRAMQRIKNPQLQSFMNRWHQADDAQLLAMVIMSQNGATNMMFYGDKDPFKKTESRMDRLAQLVGRAEVGRNAVREKIKKPVKTVGTIAEWALRKGAKITNKVVSNTGRALTRAPAGILGTLNRAMERRTMENGKDKMHIKRYAAPLWAVTRLMEESFVAANKGFNYTNTNGNKIMHDARAKTIEMLQDGFNDKNITNIFQGFTHTLDGATKFLAEGVASGGNAVYDIRDAAQKRSVLSAFFEAASEEHDLAELMGSCDIANMLNLKVRWPHLFNEDGRGMNLDKVEKYPDNDAGSNALTSDTFAKWHEDLQKQFKAHFDGIKGKYDDADAQLDTIMPSHKDYDEIKNKLSSIGVTLDTLNDKQSQINQLMLLLANMGSSSTKDFDKLAKDIKIVVDGMKKNITDGEKVIDNAGVPLGYKQQLKKKDDEITAAKAKLETIDRKLGSTVKKGDEATSKLKDARKKKQEESNKLEISLVDFEDEVLKQDGKIRGYEDGNKTLKDKNAELVRNKTEVTRKRALLPKNEKEIGLINDKISSVAADQKLAIEIPGQITQLNRELDTIKKWDSRKKLEELNNRKTSINDEIRKKSKDIRFVAEVTSLRDELKQIEQDISDVKAGKGVVDPAVAKDIDDKIADLTVQLRGLKDRNYYNRELERLNSQLNHLEADRRADEKYVFESKDPKVLIKELEDQIVDNEKQILSNITEIKKAEKARSDAKKKAADTQLKIKEITNEIRDLDQQISSKSSDDKSWVDYNSEKVKLEAIVAKATREKVSLEGKIKKQEEKNKVHRTIRKWGNRVQATATQLQAVQMGPLTAEAKRKEIMKLMKTLDLSFTKAPESKGKFDFNSLTDAQKAQIAAILNPTA